MASPQDGPHSTPGEVALAAMAEIGADQTMSSITGRSTGTSPGQPYRKSVSPAPPSGRPSSGGLFAPGVTASVATSVGQHSPTGPPNEAAGGTRSAGFHHSSRRQLKGNRAPTSSPADALRGQSDSVRGSSAALRQASVRSIEKLDRSAGLAGRQPPPRREGTGAQGHRRAARGSLRGRSPTSATAGTEEIDALGASTSIGGSLSVSGAAPFHRDHQKRVASKRVASPAGRGLRFSRGPGSAQSGPEGVNPVSLIGTLQQQNEELQKVSSQHDQLKAELRRAHDAQNVAGARACDLTVAAMRGLSEHRSGVNASAELSRLRELLCLADAARPAGAVAEERAAAAVAAQRHTLRLSAAAEEAASREALEWAQDAAARTLQRQLRPLVRALVADLGEARKCVSAQLRIPVWDKARGPAPERDAAAEDELRRELATEQARAASLEEQLRRLKTSADAERKLHDALCAERAAHADTQCRVSDLETDLVTAQRGEDRERVARQAVEAQLAGLRSARRRTPTGTPITPGRAGTPGATPLGGSARGARPTPRLGGARERAGSKASHKECGAMGEDDAAAPPPPAARGDDRRGVAVSKNSSRPGRPQQVQEICPPVPTFSDIVASRSPSTTHARTPDARPRVAGGGSRSSTPAVVQSGRKADSARMTPPARRRYSPVRSSSPAQLSSSFPRGSARGPRSAPVRQRSPQRPATSTHHAPRCPSPPPARHSSPQGAVRESLLHLAAERVPSATAAAADAGGSPRRRPAPAGAPRSAAEIHACPVVRLDD